MSKDQHDPTTAISPTPSNCIDGLGTNKRQRTGSEEEEQRRASAMATSSSCSSSHRAQDPNQSYQRMRLQTTPDRHAPRSGPNSYRQMNEQLTT